MITDPKQTRQSPAVPTEVMTNIYEKIKTPYKLGAVMKFEDAFCDSAVVFRYEDRFLMSFVKIDRAGSTGYTTHLAESDDLIHWKVLGQILKGDNGWDSRQTGGYANFTNPDFYGDNRIMPINGTYRFAYVGGSLTGYETDPLMMGYAVSPDLLKLDSYEKFPEPILRPDDPDARSEETKTLYKADMFRDPNEVLGFPYVCAYNAKNDTNRESIFLAVSNDGEKWERYGERPIISVFDCDDSVKINGDPQIVMIDGYYVMFYFCYGSSFGAYDTFAVSKDLLHWTKWQGEPLVKSEYEWENVFAHKPWVICHNGVVYHYYCAVNRKKERFIALAVSKNMDGTY